MNIEEVRAYCLAKKETNESFPFDESTLVIKVMDKMFAVCPLENPCTISLKCDPDYAIELREQYEAITPAWHFNKKYWNTLDFSKLPQTLTKELIDLSYQLVVEKLPKYKQKIINS